jgi:Cu/Ag efflux protein CusF
MAFFPRAIRLASACALFSFSACQSPQGSTGRLPSGTLAEDEVTETAIVEKIDLKTRRVTLSLPDGRERTIVVPEEVRNLPQVQRGDQVQARYYRSVAFEVKPAGSGEPGVSVATDEKHTEMGQLPAAIASETTTVTATITGIDMQAGTVTLTDSEGERETVKVRNPDDLERVKQGDLVDISYTQAVAISVERLPKK